MLQEGQPCTQASPRGVVCGRASASAGTGSSAHEAASQSVRRAVAAASASAASRACGVRATAGCPSRVRAAGGAVRPGSLRPLHAAASGVVPVRRRRRSAGGRQPVRADAAAGAKHVRAADAGEPVRAGGVPRAAAVHCRDSTRPVCVRRLKCLQCICTLWPYRGHMSSQITPHSRRLLNGFEVLVH